MAYISKYLPLIHIVEDNANKVRLTINYHVLNKNIEKETGLEGII